MRKSQKKVWILQNTHVKQETLENVKEIGIFEMWIWNPCWGRGFEIHFSKIVNVWRFYKSGFQIHMLEFNSKDTWYNVVGLGSVQLVELLHSEDTCYKGEICFWTACTVQKWTNPFGFKKTPLKWSNPLGFTTTKTLPPN